MAEFIRDLKEHIAGLVLPMESMRKHTTWKIGGPAEVMVIPQNVEDVIKALRIAGQWDMNITVIGNGSNLLVADAGIKGMVLKLAGGLNNWQINANNIIAGAGCLLPVLARRSVGQNLAGLEFAAGIPASLGGALVMNAGAHGSDIGSLIEEVSVCDLSGAVYRFKRAECGFDYRTSRFQKENFIILSAVLGLQPGDKTAGEERISVNLAKRRQGQPLDYPNAGSVFRNMPQAPAGKLIDSAGAKGLRVGDAMVSEKHANFIVNLGNATAADMLSLIQRIQSMVFDKYQVVLHPEVKMLGDFAE